MKKVLLTVIIAMMATLLFGQFENSIITCSSDAVNIGDDFEISISTTELMEEWSVTAFQLNLDFDPTIISYTGFTAGEVVAGTGSLLANESTPGHIIVAFANAFPMSGVGNLVTLSFSGLAEGNTVLDLNEFKYNATYLANANQIDGNVAVTEYNPFQDVVINTGSGSVTVGSSIEIPITTTMLTNDMGAISFQFDLLFDTNLLDLSSFALGTVPNPGNLIANESTPGVISVAYANVMPVTGEGTLCTLTFDAVSAGTTDLVLDEFKYNSTFLYNLENGSIQVNEWNPFDETTITAGSANAAIGGIVEIPVSTTELTTDMGAISFQFDLAFDNSLLTFDSFSLGDVPNPGNLIANESTPGVISVAYANVMPITGEGTLCNLTFVADAAGISALELQEFKYNSTFLNNLEDGIIEVSSVQYPDWAVNAPDYEYSGTIWGVVLLDDVEVDITTGMLGCFVDGECRGIAQESDNSAQYMEYFDRTFYMPMVYSNVTSGETIEFLYFDPITQEVYPVSETLEFQSDMFVGDGFSPYEFHASTVTTVDISKNFVAGWNWFSVNVLGEDMSANGVLSSIGMNGSNIKSQTQSAIYYPGPGWLGSLTSISNETFYKIDVNNPVTWEYTGTPLDLASTTYDLTAGWNWISYAPQSSQSINTALGEVTQGTNIKSQTQSAIYYPGPGWLGSLTTLNPLAGYMLQMNNPESFNYPAPEALVAEKQVVANDITLASASNDLREVPDWTINAPDYEYSCSAWAVISMNGIEVLDTTGMLGCFVGEECRGIAQASDNSIQYFEYFGRTYFMPMMYSNSTSGETITFKYYDPNTDMVFDIPETLDFVADAVYGDGFTPVEFTVETGGNLPPMADAGDDQVVTEGDLVTLDASGSSDPEGEALTYLWTAPEGITLDDPTAVMPTFTAPDVMMDMDYIFTLVVNDGELDSNEAEVMVTVQNVWVFEESMIMIGSADVTELDIFTVPVTTSPLDAAWGIISFQFELYYDAEVVSFQNCTLGAVPNPSMLVFNEQEPGHLSVAYANAMPVSGEGELCTLEFQAIGMGGNTALDIEEFKYNQTFMSNLVDGMVNITPLDNHPPTIELPDSFQFVTNETLELDFDMYCEDVDGDELTLTAGGQTDIVVDIDGLMVTLSAPADWTGSETVTFMVSDNYVRDIDMDDVEIIVTLPNPELYLELPATMSLVTNATSIMDFEEYITYLNLDPNTLTLEVEGNSNIDVDIDGFEVTFTSDDWIGTEVMTFTVGDETTRISATDEVAVSVVNFENSVITVENITVDDGEDFDLSITTSILDASWNIIAFQCSLYYDVNYLTYNSITAANGIASAGTILGNEVAPGVVSFAYMHYLPIEGVGEICSLNFTAHGIGNTNVHIWDFKYNSTYMLEENLYDGMVTINDIGNQYVPIADAGEDQSVIGGDMVTLDGSGSFDMNGDALTYAWTAPAGITLNNAAAIMPTFTAPVNTTVEDYVFSLVVTDDDGASDPDEVIVTVIPPNMPPVADAGDDVSVWENMTVMLDGSDSYDPDGDAITFLWEAPGLTIDDPTSETPIITAPEVDDDTEYTVTLTVSDGMATGSDELTVTVMNVTIPLNPPTNLNVVNMDDGDALFTWSPPSAGGGIEEGFEVWPPDGWVFLDEDGDGFEWDDGGELGLDPHTGDGVAYSASYTNEAGALNPDNWLISPSINLNGTGSVNYFVCAQDAAWAGEHYGVYISDSGTDPADFDLLFEETMTARSTGRVDRLLPKGSREQGAWYERTVEIDGYSGSCYIAFRHFNVTDMFYLDLDDVTIAASMARPLVGYNVYLDGELQNDDPIAETEYLFEDLDDGVEYEAGVVAVYDEGYSEMATTTFTYIANQAPVADAGSDMTLRDGMVITLDATGSFDPDGDALTYSWTAPGGITLTNGNTATPSFTAPAVTNDTDYTFTVEVSDGEYTDTDDVVITIQDDEPMSVTATHLANPQFVQLEWVAPGIGGETGEWIHHDDGMNNDGIGLTAGGSFLVAARWDAGDLDDFDGLQVTKMNFFPRSALCDYTLKVWTGANAGTEVVSQPITDFEIEMWNEVYFTTPYTIDSSVELWIGYAVDNQPAGEYPAGTDAGPAIAGYGDMISTNGTTWDALSGFGLNYNWNIQAYVAGATRPLVTSNHEQPAAPFFTAENCAFAAGSLPVVDITTRDERSFLVGFNVYKDDVLEEEGLEPDETSYIFMNVDGDHSYGVAAVYNDGISDIESVFLADEDINTIPTVTELKGNYPNPFNPETSIELSVAQDDYVTVVIYNSRGQKVRTLVNEFMSAGTHNAVWHGKDDAGNSVGSGIYFYKMKSGRYTSTKKMILMK